ncbi:MAG: hypothetical protein AB9Q23_09225 [Candidatus Reddybacter sp.]
MASPADAANLAEDCAVQLQREGDICSIVEVVVGRQLYGRTLEHALLRLVLKILRVLEAPRVRRRMLSLLAVVTVVFQWRRVY